MADVEYSVDGHVAKVHLNCPQGMNAITRKMDELLLEAWTRINADPEICAVILSAEGERAFCIGGDVSGGVERKTPVALGGGLTGIGGPLVRCTKPMVAAVQGFCVGGGFELAMCADIIIAADTAQFGLPETRVGIMAECGVVHRAIRQLPYHIAMQLILTGERITADKALHFGLVNEVVPYADLADTALRWAAKLEAASRFAAQAAAPTLARLDYPLDIALSTRSESIGQIADSAGGFGRDDDMARH